MVELEAVLAAVLAVGPVDPWEVAVGKETVLEGVDPPDEAAEVGLSVAGRSETAVTTEPVVDEAVVGAVGPVLVEAAAEAVLSELAASVVPEAVVGVVGPVVAVPEAVVGVVGPVLAEAATEAVLSELAASVVPEAGVDAGWPVEAVAVPATVLMT